MFDLLTILTAAWFAIIALIIAQIFTLLPFPRLRVALPLLFGTLLGLTILITNPGLESGYRGQMNYLGPFCFPVIVPLLISVPLIVFRMGDGIIRGKTDGFFGTCISAFLFLTLYQSGFFYGRVPEFVGSVGLIGSALVISSMVLFIVQKYQDSFPRVLKETPENNSKDMKKKPEVNLKMIGLLVIYLLASLSPLYLIDFMNNHDRATMGQLTVYQPETPLAPNGSVMHLTESEFQEYPELRSLILSSHQARSTVIRINNTLTNTTELGMEWISCEKESQMRNEGLINSGYTPAPYLEFENRLYVVSILHYAGEDCVPVSLFS
jgi:hypothetical protein